MTDPPIRSHSVFVIHSPTPKPPFSFGCECEFEERCSSPRFDSSPVVCEGDVDLIAYGNRNLDDSTSTVAYRVR
jgi:hypothetical protein